MPNLTSVSITDGKPDTGTGTVSTIDALMALLGEVQASPTANTLLDRVKTLSTLLTTQAGYLDGLEALVGTSNTSLASILAKITADPATQTTLAAVLAKITADPSTATLQTAANTLLTTLTDAIKAEDAPHVSSDKGIMSLAVRKDSAASLAGTDGDYAPLQVDATGALRTTGSGGGSAGTEYVEDAAAAADPSGGMLMAVRRDTLSGSEVSADGDNIALKATSKGQLHVYEDSLNTAIGTKADAKNTATDTTAVSAISIWKQISSSIQAAAASLAGTLTVATHAVTQSGTWTVQPGNTANTTAWKVDGSAVTSPISATSLPLPTGAATSAKQDTLIAAVPASLGQKTMANSLAVALASDQGAISVSAASTGHTTAVTLTRTADTAAYTANDVLGAATGSTAALTFANMAGTSGGNIMVTSVELEIDATAVISGETNYLLHLYNVTPPSALGDNAAFDLPSGDRASYLGSINLGFVVDLGSTLYLATDGVNKHLKLSGTSIFAYLVTVGAYTPTSARVYKITLHSVDL